MYNNNNNNILYIIMCVCEIHRPCSGAHEGLENTTLYRIKDTYIMYRQ